MKVEDVKKAARPAKWAAVIGFTLALACQLVPEHYRALCEVLTSVCSAGGK